jgi:hypothetical protein
VCLKHSLYVEINLKVGGNNSSAVLDRSNSMIAILNLVRGVDVCPLFTC